VKQDTLLFIWWGKTTCESMMHFFQEFLFLSVRDEHPVLFSFLFLISL